MDSKEIDRLARLSYAERCIDQSISHIYKCAFIDGVKIGIKYQKSRQNNIKENLNSASLIDEIERFQTGEYTIDSPEFECLNRLIKRLNSLLCGKHNKLNIPLSELKKALRSTSPNIKSIPFLCQLCNSRYQGCVLPSRRRCQFFEQLSCWRSGTV